eukprot:8403248-Pyramimonas_sp.AAC.1
MGSLTSVLDCTGSSRNQPFWATTAHDHAQGEWRPSMTTVFLPLRLSAASCYPLFQNFRRLAYQKKSNRQHYQQMPELNKNRQKADKEAGIKPRKIPNIVEEGNDD